MRYARVLASIAVTVTNTASAQSPVPVRTVGAVEARTAEGIGAVLGQVRELPGGNLLVNDASRRRVLLFAGDLASYSVVIDSVSGAANSYGPRPATMIPYLGDSTLFVDFQSQALLVIDPGGKVVRVMSAPNARDLSTLSISNAGVDGHGRLIYRGRTPSIAPAIAPQPGQPGVLPPPPDSFPLVRADFETRTVDTLFQVRFPSTVRAIRQISVAGAPMRVMMTMNPLPTTDEWAVLSDGSIGVVRGHDYHVDWLLSDGTRTASPKLPFDWRRITDDDKIRIIDSARTAQEAQRAAAAAARAQAQAASGSTAPARGGTAAPGAVFGETEFVEPKELPDYHPPLRAGATRADADANLWILPTTSTQSLKGELVYDVVNRNDGLTHRVRIPLGRTIAGFGRGGVVYLMSGDRTAGFYIERTRLVASAPASH